MPLHSGHDAAIRYRGFLLLSEGNNNWLVRPERSPMLFLPFRIAKSTVDEVKNKVDMLLLESNFSDQAA